MQRVREILHQLTDADERLSTLEDLLLPLHVSLTERVIAPSVERSDTPPKHGGGSAAMRSSGAEISAREAGTIRGKDDD